MDIYEVKPTGALRDMVSILLEATKAIHNVMKYPKDHKTISAENAVRANISNLTDKVDIAANIIAHITVKTT